MPPDSEKAGFSDGKEGSSRSRATNLSGVIGILLFFTIWLGGSGLIVGAWLSPVLPGGWATVGAGMAGGAVAMITLVRGFLGASYPSALTRLLILRPMWYAMLVLPLLAIVSLIGAAVGLAFGSAGDGARWTIAICAALMVVLGLAGWAGSRRLVVKQLEVRMPRLPQAFDGLRVVQISDLHVGPHTSRRFLRRVAEAVRQAEPDLIAITGDQVDDFARDVALFNEAFSELEAPLGTFAVAGNHDVYAGWEAVQRGMEEAGFTVLVNRAVALGHDGQRLWVAGTGDPAARSWQRQGGHSAVPDINRTLAGIPADEAVLALAHNPVLWPALVERGVDLTLSGHTHYGQFAIPSLRWCMASPFLELAMGCHRRGHSLLYIHPGSNFWGIPFRLGAYPEIMVLTLRSSLDATAEFVQPSEP
ncbi:MAG: metallophosphoesterase [Acidobacteriota bacterium]